MICANVNNDTILRRDSSGVSLGYRTCIVRQRTHRRRATPAVRGLYDVFSRDFPISCSTVLFAHRGSSFVGNARKELSFESRHVWWRLLWLGSRGRRGTHIAIASFHLSQRTFRQSLSCSGRHETGGALSVARLHPVPSNRTTALPIPPHSHRSS
jgi:hypothetical protein